MNTNTLTKILIITAIIFGCKSIGNPDEIVKIQKFNKEVHLKCKPIPHNLKFGQHDIYMLSDSLALFYTLYDKDYCLRIVNINNFELIKSVGKIGRGPGEIVNPGYVFIDSEKNDIWISSGGSMKIFKFPLDSILSQDNYLPTTIIDMKGKMIIDYTIKNDSLEYYNTITEKQIMFKVEKGNKTRSFIDKHISTSNMLIDMDLNFSMFQMHPSNEKLVIAYIHDDFLVISKSNGDIIRKIKGPSFINVNDYINDTGKSKKAAYQKIVVDEKYIYCLYRGSDKGTREKYGSYIRNDAKTILIFNWDGEPVKRIYLDKSIYNFDIDKKRNRFLAYSAENEDAIISIDYDF